MGPHGQVLEKREGTDETKDTRQWENGKMHAEGLERRCQLAERVEGDGIATLRPNALHDQLFHTGKALDPLLLFYASQGTINRQGVSVTCG